MRLACTGGKGKVGTYLKRLGVVDLESDVTNVYQLEESIKLHRPQVIIHLASISDVDYCEDRSHSKEVAKVNIVGTKNILDVARHFNIGVVFLSTVQVFNGRKWWGDYRETDSPLAINTYGISKMAGEALMEEYENMKIVRTSRLFDSGCIDFSKNSYPTFIKRSYMYLGHFANSMLMFARKFYSMPTILNIAGSKTVSEFEFMCAAADACGYNASGIVARKQEQGNYAPRPKRGGLDVNRSKLLGFPQYDYREGLVQMRRDLS